MLFRQIVFNAILVGVLSGFTLTVVQLWQVIPIIQKAEVFETDDISSHSHDQHGHDHSAEWAPEDGIERTAFTLLSNVLTAIGFALLIMTVMIAATRLRPENKYITNWYHGLIWGMVGFLVFWLVPAIGLPPEIPGTNSATLETRQIWWLLAVICTAAGLAGLTFAKFPWRFAAPALIVIPFLVGAPHPTGEMFEGNSPEVVESLESLSQQFFIATGIANAVFWLVIGLLSAWTVRQFLETSMENTTPYQTHSV